MSLNSISFWLELIGFTLALLDFKFPNITKRIEELIDEIEQQSLNFFHRRLLPIITIGRSKLSNREERVKKEIIEREREQESDLGEGS